MESITIIPRNKRQSSIIKSFFKEMDIPFINSEEVKIPESEEDKYYPILDEKIKKALENKKEGKTVTLKPTDNAEDFWKQIREYEIELDIPTIKQLKKLEKSGKHKDIERVYKFIEEIKGFPRAGAGKP